MFKYVIGLSAAALLAGVVASPAQALTGSLAFSNGTDDWFSELAPGAGDTFDIEFNPFDLNFVTTQNGDFTPPFDGSPVQGVAASIGEFEFVSQVASTFTYALTNDLVFAYDNGATVTWGAGTLFEGFFNGPASAEFALHDSGIGAAVTGIGEDVTVIMETFQFSDTEAIGGGTYNSQINVTSVPEPASILGLVTIGAVAAGGALKKKATA